MPKKKKVQSPEMNRIYNEDNWTLTERMEPESVDILFTDPPYVTEPLVDDMPMWEWAYLRLAAIAGHVLKPSGFVITYAPQAHLPDIMDILKTGSTCGICTNDSPRLNYFWIIQSINSGPVIKAHKWNALCLHKPILIYQKGEFKSPSRCFADVLRGKRQKRFHPWQQSIQDVIGILDRFMMPGQVLYDPFAGTGTTLLAGKLLGMQWIGAEIDENTYKKAMNQLSQSTFEGLDHFEKVPE
jgi:hypothetical protein